jgi:hypothetical protein
MGCPCHKNSGRISGGKMGLTKADWLEVEVRQEMKLTVPEWTTVQVHVGQKIKLPPKFIDDHAEWFLIPGQPVAKGKGYHKAILDLKSPKEA